MDITTCWLTLLMTPGLGPTTSQRLVGHFGGVQNLLEHSLQDIQNEPSTRKLFPRKIQGEWPRQQARAEYLRAEQSGITLLHQDSPAYPGLLREIHDPPVLLYVRGNAALLQQGGIAIVGARAASNYGKQAAKHFAAEIGLCGLVVYSGLALGIDSAAHHGALEAGTATVAVLGCGIDIAYPPQNKKLFAQMAENGALVSEYPFGTRPEAFRFPARNRIVSGLALGVLVIEAAKKSGSLITAKYALEQGREVFALPGRVDSLKSEGTHRLLQEGAKLVTNLNDILDELPPHHYLSRSPVATAETARKQIEGLTQDERQVMAQLDEYAKNIDELCWQLDMPIEKINQTLLMLEMKGFVESEPGPKYRSARS